MGSRFGPPVSTFWAFLMRTAMRLKNSLQEGHDDTVLVAPFALVFPYTPGLDLHDLAFLLSFGIYPCQWDNPQRLV